MKLEPSNRSVASTSNTMKNIINSLIVIILIIIIISCNKEESTPQEFPITYEMDTSMLEMSDYTCFTIDQNVAKEIPIQGSFKMQDFILYVQKAYLYEYGYLKGITIIDDSNAELRIKEEDGTITSHTSTYQLNGQKVIFDGISSPDVFYTMSDDNSRLTFTWCSTYYIRFGGTFPITTLSTDYCPEHEIKERILKVQDKFKLDDGDSLALFYSNENYERQ